MNTRKQPCVFTIGHSTRTISQFFELLEAHGIEEIVDVRTIPISRYHPQFNRDTLRVALKRRGIAYQHLAMLGGLRRAQKNSINLGWQNASFRGFADHMQTPEFSEGFRQLKAIAAMRQSAIMCAEAVPWRCHRSLIADALVKGTWRVFHIQNRKTLKRHVLTTFLKVRHGKCVYPSPHVRMEKNSPT